MSDINQLIQERAKQIDLERIPSKSAEMARRLDALAVALGDVLAFAQALDVEIAYERSFKETYAALTSDSMPKWTITARRNNTVAWFGIEQLDDPSASIKAVAQVHDVSEQQLIAYEERTADGRDAYTEIPCNHAGCRMAKTISFYSPAEMQVADRRAASEIWYCRHHRTEAYRQNGALSDLYLAFLDAIAANPGCNLASTGYKRGDLDFLESIGLVRSEVTNSNSRQFSYRLFLTAAGVACLSNLQRISEATTPAATPCD